MNAVLKFGIGLVVSGLAFVFCNTQEASYTMYDLRFEDGELSGWNEVDDKGYLKFTSSDMYKTVNGGAKEYEVKGLSEGFYQNMANGEKTYESYVMDFGSADNAKEMYDTKLKALSASKEDASGFSEDEAFIEPSLYGYNGYAIFGNLMVVIWLDNYGANKSEAKNNIVEFLKTIEKKISDLDL